MIAAEPTVPPTISKVTFLGVGGRLIVDSLQPAQHARVEAAARELLGEELFAAPRADGRRLGLDDVLRLAMGEDAEMPQA